MARAPKLARILDTKELKDVVAGWRWGRRPVIPRSAEGHTLPPEPWSFPTDWARTEPARIARNVILDVGLRTIIRNETTPEVFGLENLDHLKGPVMFISNHTSHLDASLILTTLPREWRDRTAVAAAKDYFFDVWWRSAFTALVYAGFPVERGGGERATDKARQLIRDGWSIVVFPEGTRSPDGWVQRFRHGAARLAIEMGMPVVPIAIVGAYAAMPRGRSWPRPGRPPIRMRFGAAVIPEPGESHQELSIRMQQAIAELFDEDRTSWWDAMHRSRRGETPKLSGPAGPGWLRSWEGSRPVQRSGPPPAWR